MSFWPSYHGKCVFPVFYGKLGIFLEIAFVLFAFLAMLNRIQYGIEFTDESWYVAEPYAVAELGATPFVNNVTQSPGWTLPLALAFKAYVWLNGSTVGIVYFSRVLYLCVHFALSALTVWIVNRYTPYKVPVLAIGALFAINHAHSFFDITYNTIGMMYFPLIMALVFAEYEDEDRRSFFWGLMAGLLAVRAVMGTPQIVIGLLVVFFYLCVKKKRNRVLGIILGAGLACAIILGAVCVGWGFERLCTWFLMYVHQGYFSIGSVRPSWGEQVQRMSLFFRPAVFVATAFIVLCIIRKKYPTLFTMQLPFFVVASVLAGMMFSVRGNDYVGYKLMRWTWFLPYLYWLVTRRNNGYIGKIALINTAYLFIFFFASLTDIYGFCESRAYWNYVPLLLSVCCLVNIKDAAVWQQHSMQHAQYLLFLMCTVFLAAFGLWKNYSYVYRDSPISSLLTKVDDGIWRGLYTTKSRADNVVPLERYIKSVTKNNEEILFLDWVSFGYLMTSGQICSPTTLDASFFSYKVNLPRLYYRYFQAEQTVPDKIIYIDYGRDKHLSIDDGQWDFNELVWRHYHFVGAYRNELFYVRVYVLDDREGAMRLVEETLKG